MKHKKLAKIVVSVLFAIALASTASAVGESVTIKGYGYESDGVTPAWFDGLNITVADTEYNQTTTPQVKAGPGLGYQGYYIVTFTNGTHINPGNTLSYYAVNGTRINNTAGFTWDGVSLAITYNVTFPPTGQPDLIPIAVWDNPGKGGYLFANEPNDIKVNINNSGSAGAGNFDVTLEIDSYTETKNVGSLAAGTNTNVTFTGYAPTTTGTKTVNITVDKVNVIAESNEANNLLSTSRIVYYNGYKGKRWTGGADIATVENYNIKGNVNYSTGTSAYTSAFWNSISASWSSVNLPIPSTATVLSTKLYIFYNWDRTSNALWGNNTTFNGVTYPRSGAVQYSDMKMWGTYATNAYGVLVYNVTSNFNKSGNSANITGTSVDAAVDGMILQVVYSDTNEPQRMIWINEGYDLLMVSTASGTDITETKAYAPFTGGPSINLAKVASARLMAVGLGVTNTTGDKTNVIFNSNNHQNTLPFSASQPPGSAVIDVTSELGTSNTAIIHDNGDSGGMRAATTILVVEEKPGMKIDLGGPYDTEVGRHIMVPIKANGFEQFYGTVEMNFSYNTSKFDVVAVHSNPQSTITAYQDYPSTGILDISALNTAGVKGDVVLATVELNVVGGKDTSSQLDLTVGLLQDIYGATIYRYTVPATVNIGNPGDLVVTSATSTPQSFLSIIPAILNENGRARHAGDNETEITAVVTDSGLGINSVTVDLSAIGGSAATVMSETSPGTYTVKTKATAGINGTYSFIVTAKDNGGNTATRPTNDLTIYRRGDVVRNDIVNMGDALYIARYTVGLETPSTDHFNFVGDLMPASDSDYTVNMGDALYIARHSVGLEPAP